MRYVLVSAAVVLALLGCRTAGSQSPPARELQSSPPAAEAAPPPVPETPPAEASPPPVPEHFENVLRWSTASEVENFGYDVYRGTTEDGPFERLTGDPIPGAGTTDVPSHYSYTDASIDPHQQYYYYVECISFAGVRKRFTPVIAAKPKLPPAGPASRP